MTAETDINRVAAQHARDQLLLATAGALRGLCRDRGLLSTDQHLVETMLALADATREPADISTHPAFVAGVRAAADVCAAMIDESQGGWWWRSKRSARRSAAWEILARMRKLAVQRERRT